MSVEQPQDPTLEDYTANFIDRIKSETIYLIAWTQFSDEARVKQEADKLNSSTREYREASQIAVRTCTHNRQTRERDKALSQAYMRITDSFYTLESMSTGQQTTTTTLLDTIDDHLNHISDI